MMQTLPPASPKKTKQTNNNKNPVFLLNAINQSISLTSINSSHKYLNTNLVPEYHLASVGNTYNVRSIEAVLHAVD